MDVLAGSLFTAGHVPLDPFELVARAAVAVLQVVWVGADLVAARADIDVGTVMRPLTNWAIEREPPLIDQARVPSASYRVTTGESREREQVIDPSWA